MRFFEKFFRRPVRLVLLGVGLTIFLSVPPIWMTSQAYLSFSHIIKQDFRLRQLSDEITYFDEVLTMSALMNAATGDQKWERRYRQTEPQLDASIQESIAITSDVYSSADAEKTDAANQQLIELESQSFDLVSQGRQQEAFSLLSSSRYATLKQQYKQGVERRNQAIEAQLEQQIRRYQQQLIFSISLSSLILALLIPIWLLVLKILKTHLERLRQAQNSLKDVNENLEKLVEERSRDLREKNAQLDQALSELKQTQIQVVQNEKMSALGQMMAGITHEIKNPVSFLSGNLIYAQEYIQALVEHLHLYQKNYPNPVLEIKQHSKKNELDYLQQDLPKLINSLRIGVDRIQEISQSMRIFSRSDAENQVKFDLRKGLDSTLLILKHRLKANASRSGIEVIRNYDELPDVMGFPGQLNQVFMNILANAIDVFDEVGEAQSSTQAQRNRQATNQILIRTRFIAADNTVVVRIQDNGPGMSEAVKEKVFDHLFTTKEVGKGTGLGLSISRQIVEETHGGKLTCISELDKGTEFIIELPRGDDVDSASPVTE